MRRESVEQLDEIAHDLATVRRTIDGLYRRIESFIEENKDPPSAPLPSVQNEGEGNQGDFSYAQKAGAIATVDGGSSLTKGESQFVTRRVVKPKVKTGKQEQRGADAPPIKVSRDTGKVRGPNGTIIVDNHRLLAALLTLADGELHRLSEFSARQPGTAQTLLENAEPMLVKIGVRVARVGYNFYRLERI